MCGLPERKTASAHAAAVPYFNRQVYRNNCYIKESASTKNTKEHEGNAVLILSSCSFVFFVEVIV